MLTLHSIAALCLLGCVLTGHSPIRNATLSRPGLASCVRHALKAHQVVLPIRPEEMNSW